MPFICEQMYVHNMATIVHHISHKDMPTSSDSGTGISVVLSGNLSKYYNYNIVTITIQIL